MGNVRNLVFLVILCFYPFINYFIWHYFEVSTDYLFGLLVYLLLFILLLEKISLGKSILFPHYLGILALFVVYTVLLLIFKSKTLGDIGIVKYLYRDAFLRTFAILLLAENTIVSSKAIKIISKLLFGILAIAALTSMIQVRDPLFFVNTSFQLPNVDTIEEVERYFLDHPDEMDGGAMRLLQGYRFSIFSWINDISVGMDGMAIFSILIALKTFNYKSKVIVLISGVLTGFLSNSRWIMLNLVIISSQLVFLKRNFLINVVKFFMLFCLMIVFIYLISDFIGLDMQKFVQERLLDEGASTRIYAFTVFNEVYFDNPVFGTGGVDTTEMLRLVEGRTSQIHVGWLKLLYYYGFVGGIIYTAFISALFIQLKKRAIQTNFWGAVFVIVAFAVANMTLVEFDLFYHGIILAIIFSNNVSFQDQIGTSNQTIVKEPN